MALSDYLEIMLTLDSIWCDNPKTVEKFLGIEAAQACVADQLELSDECFKRNRRL